MKSVAEKKHNMVLECSIKKTILPKGMVPFPKEMTLPTLFLGAKAPLGLASLIS